MVEHLSANPKVPGSNPGPVSCHTGVMDYDVSCIILLEWSTTSQRLWVYRIFVPYAQKDRKEKGETLGILVSRLNNRW